MKPLLVLAVAMAVTGCDFARNAGSQLAGSLNPDTLAAGVSATSEAVIARCETLDSIVVRLAIDSAARVSGTTRHIDRLRRERREVCTEAERLRDLTANTSAKVPDTTPAP
ncbi:MAG: hypothetical protein AAGD13_02925 [Pseudomonadota bacterium]